jgi:hypothetical protein
MNRAGRPTGLAVALTLTLLALGAAAPRGGARPDKAKLGLLLNDPKACQGYTLLASGTSTNTYLIDMRGRVVRTWESDCHPGLAASLLENGNLLRAGQLRNPPFMGGGHGGRVQEFTWEGKLVWDYRHASESQLPHHDVCRLPNGNVLLIAWEKKTAREAVAAGRRPETVKEYLLTDCILEVKPTGKTTGKVVWEWRAWDHLIQDFDPKKPNHGDAGTHPELIDVNFGEWTIASMVAKPEELKKLQAIGYIGGAGRKPQRVYPDWTHINSVAYNPTLDQVMLSVPEFGEIWVIDHGTTTAEAAGHKGGRSGKGGDLLYRWGNPRAYRAGTVRDQKLFSQHHAHWIAGGLPGEGNILLFNNGLRRTGGAYSSVEEIVPPLVKGRYERTPGKAFGPDKPLWSYSAPKRIDFFSQIVSGAQRLPNGNTLICAGTNGTIFEVTPKKETVWKYVNPVKRSVLMRPSDDPPRLGQILAPRLQRIMRLTAQQKQQLEAIDKQTAERLDKTFTGEQKKILARNPKGFRGLGFVTAPGRILSVFVAERLKLTAKQRRQVALIQEEARTRLDKILKEEQRRLLRRARAAAVRRPADPAAGGPPGAAAGGFGPPGGQILFRAFRYDAKYPGLAGKDLKPGRTVEELQPQGPPGPPRKK